MARKLGYGGIANTNGARDFSGKAESSDSFLQQHPTVSMRGVSIQGFILLLMERLFN